MRDKLCLDENFYGVATVNERGQIVIPAEARKNADIQPGDKVLVIGHPVHGGLLLTKLDSLREVLAYFLGEIDKLEIKANASPEESGE